MAKPAGCLKAFFSVPLLLMAIGVGFWFLGNINQLLTHDTVEGVVIDLERSVDSDGDDLYKPTYEYEVAGQTYRYKSQVSYGGLLVPEIGDRRSILYNPGNPSDAQVRSMFVLIWLPLILLALPLLILGFMLWASIRRRRRLTEVPTQLGPSDVPPWVTQPPGPTAWAEPEIGQRTPIEAMFMGTEPSQMDDKGKVKYRVKARADIDGTQHRFRSDWLENDPTLYYMQHGNKVTVHVNRSDPSSYEVELPPTE
ncbi:MAG: DUF3592 domain-containing protein [Acidimicrobiia bacterium]|nr:DUF3592 domain-containing protein [Acidimicrobiia bacterium]MDX2467968.1 DUF3592 domain-containing protein [Acidimicrobiia bacterium]